MNVLAIDTCFSFCSVGASAGGAAGGARVCCQSLRLDTGHAEALMPMVERVMRDIGLAFGEIDRIVVTRGPGTFTGVRTGIAAARGLALATGAPIVAVSSLWAMAGGVLDQRGVETHPDDVVIATADARKGQVYAQAIDAHVRELNEPAVLAPHEAVEAFPGRRLVVAGSGAGLVEAAARACGREIVLHCANGDATLTGVPDVAFLLRAAADRPPTERPTPLYLRPPDAKPQSAKSLPWSLP